MFRCLLVGNRINWSRYTLSYLIKFYIIRYIKNKIFTLMSFKEIQAIKNSRVQNWVKCMWKILFILRDSKTMPYTVQTHGFNQKIEKHIGYLEIKFWYTSLSISQGKHNLQIIDLQGEQRNYIKFKIDYTLSYMFYKLK